MPALPPELLDAIAHHWGFRTLRPLQERAMQAALADRDSLVVMPTGGGKSLCYQAPAVYRGGTTVVVSPLIALMKDQVDRLNTVGVPAVRLDSSLTAAERTRAEARLAGGDVRLVFLSPERLAMGGLPRLLAATPVQSVAIDEAHCISAWGHDFRPEYRMLGQLRTSFPGVSVHAYTATATEQVRRDIVAQLGLRDPDVIVGVFDRPNLTYRVLPRLDVLKQVEEVIERNPGGAGIVYCLRRADVESLAAGLAGRGHKALGYHAGMTPDDRRRIQEAFASGDADVIAATIAFGMGIDRADVRYVVHAFMPKSLEGYQQETGRAGRDGLPAECVLLHSGGDIVSLKNMIAQSAAKAGEGGEAFLPAALAHLTDMDRYARGAVCRHKALSAYFDQDYPLANCGACDLCLGDTDDVPDAAVVAQKILSCVARVKESFGAGHVVAVLRGEQSEAVRSRGHDQLSTYGLLRDVPKPMLRDWVLQLVGQDVLAQVGDEYPILKLNAASWEVMKGKRPVRLIQIARREKTRRERGPRESSAGAMPHPADAMLFEQLRTLRRELAAAEGVPPFLVFSDVVLKALAQVRPTTPDAMRQVSGVGDIKLANYGEAFLAVIRPYAAENPRPEGYSPPPPPPSAPRVTGPANARRQKAFELFRADCVVPDVMHQLGVARSTAFDYLAQYIAQEKPADVSAWVSDAVYQEVAAVAREVGVEKLKPIFDALNGQVSYDDIRVVLAHLARNG